MIYKYKYTYTNGSLRAVIDNSHHQTTYYTTDGYQIYNTDTTPETLLFESKYDEDGSFTETTNGVTYSYVGSDLVSTTAKN